MLLAERINTGVLEHYNQGIKEGHEDKETMGN